MNSRSPPGALAAGGAEQVTGVLSYSGFNSVSAHGSCGTTFVELERKVNTVAKPRHRHPRLRGAHRRQPPPRRPADGMSRTKRPVSAPISPATRAAAAGSAGGGPAGRGPSSTLPTPRRPSSSTLPTLQRPSSSTLPTLQRPSSSTPPTLRRPSSSRPPAGHPRVGGIISSRNRSLTNSISRRKRERSLTMLSQG